MRSRALFRWTFVIIVLPLTICGPILYANRDLVGTLVATGRAWTESPAERRAMAEAAAREEALSQLGPPLYPERPEPRKVRVTRTVYRDIEVVKGEPPARVAVQETVEQFVQPSQKELSDWATRKLDIDAQHDERMKQLVARFTEETLAGEARQETLLWVALVLPAAGLLIGLVMLRAAVRNAREERQLYEEEMAFLSTPTPR